MRSVDHVGVMIVNVHFLLRKSLTVHKERKAFNFIQKHGEVGARPNVVNWKVKKNVTLACPGRGSNPGSSVYETDALPLGHRGWQSHVTLCMRI